MSKTIYAHTPPYTNETVEFERYSNGVTMREAADISTVDYKFSEGKLIDEFKQYIDATYNQHYAKDKFQATEFIVDGGHGTGFCIGNVLKYAQRYGNKNGYNRADLMKVLHYAIIQLYVHDINGR